MPLPRALNLGERASVFGEVGANGTERGAFIVPANPNQRPLRFHLPAAADPIVRTGLNLYYWLRQEVAPMMVRSQVALPGVLR